MSDQFVVDRFDPDLSHRPSRDIFSASHLDLIRQWRNDCVNTHELCRQTTRNGLLPTRVLEIKLGKDGTHDVTLIKNSGALRGDYACLSYCWGDELKGRTTTKNIATFEEKVDLKEIPHTVADAITLCGKLGFQYLWVDRLCIIQDDEGDWSREASRMSQVYSNSALTITTPICGTASESFEANRRLGSPCTWNQSTRFSLPSGNKGQRQLIAIGRSMTRQQGPCFLEESWKQFTDKESPKSDIWITRAWTFQEWLLSPRVLHIHEWTIWDCFKASGNEVYRRSLGPNQMPRQSWDSRFSWEHIVEEYSKRQISFAKDRLPALAGLAARHAERTKHTYLAGMWLEDMPYSLLWRLRLFGFDPDMPKPKDSGCGGANIPSWSWASSSEPIWCFPPDDGHVHEASIVSHFRDSADTLSLVGFQGGWLDIEGPMCSTSGILSAPSKMSGSHEGPTDPKERFQVFTHTMTDDGREGDQWEVSLDDMESLPIAGQRRDGLVPQKCQLWLLRLLFQTGDAFEKRRYHYGLLLGGVPSIGSQVHFQRLGRCDLSNDGNELRGDWQQAIVRLV